MQQIVRVTAAIMSSSGRILIAQRRTGQHLAGKCEFPGGKMEKLHYDRMTLARQTF